MIALLAVQVAAAAAVASPPGNAAFLLQSDHLRVEIGPGARDVRFIDRKTGRDHSDRRAGGAFARVKIAGTEHAASTVVAEGDRLKLAFEGTSATAVLRATAEKSHLVFEVVSVVGEGVESFTFLDVPLTLKGVPGEPFAACALALDLRTNVEEIPGPASRLRATCYRRFGFSGARAAVIGCPPGMLRDVLKDVVSAAPDLPHSPLGGPWALEAPLARGSYLFNFGGLTEATAGEWIAVARAMGMDQIDFHGGSSFRFGDCRPDPAMYPQGLRSLKAVIDRLHAAGIAAGLHTYAFFIDKRCPWVTPAPDPRLATDATFTLAGPLDAGETAVAVREPTGSMSATTGFFVRNSATLRIDDELVTYGGVSKEPPFAFTGCRRGALGTRAAPHAAGRPVHHLKECFGLFAPDGDSTLLEEVAERTAEAFNECGFDFMYFDALDGEDVLGGAANGWHYGSKFVFEVWKRLRRPAAVEMSTFHHHLWYVRSRMGAWDHPTRSHQRFIDIHCQANEGLKRMFLPGQLGWWAVKTWSGIQGEPTFADDIQYLCAKAIGHGAGLSVMGIDPGTIDTVPAYRRLAGILRQNEELRRAGVFDESVRAELRQAGKEFTLFQDDLGRWRFRRAASVRRKVEGPEDQPNVLAVENPFGSQAPGLRIEALMSAGPYDAPGSIELAAFSGPRDFPDREGAPGVSVDLRPGTEAAPGGRPGAAFTASSAGRVGRKGAWAKARTTFSPAIDLSQRQALGVWIHGDGQGEVLNFQLTCPPHLVAGIGEHYVVVDFTGWRYFTLIEPEGERYGDYSWPYGSPYSIYRENVDYAHVEALGLWYNDLPPEKPVACRLSPIRALPLVAAKLKDPALAAGGKRIVFPVEMEPGSYLEFRPPSECNLYGPTGALLGEIRPQGAVPILPAGSSELEFTCDGPTGVRPRARVTVFFQGDPI